MRGYTSALYSLAQASWNAQWEPGALTVAITNAEPVFEHQRRGIAAAFRCPVRETYGTAEIVTAAGECEAGSLHLWPGVGWTEIIEDGRQLPVGVAGEFVCTGLLNVDMPLIRYRVGDRGAWSPDHACPCGRTLPRLAVVEGRTDDVLYTSDGRAVGRLDPVFKGGLAIHEAQIIQEAPDVVRVRYIAAPGCCARDTRAVAERLQARLGPVRIMFDEVDPIPRTPRGKFRAVICNINPV